MELAVDTGGYQFVLSACNAMACSNTIEHNAKLVYSIYAATWMQDLLEFSQSDSATLLNIALQDPIAGGTAVYSAGIMLGLEIDYFGANAQRSAQHELNSTDHNEIYVYPNPASESVNILCNVEQDQNAYCEIFDLNGKLILSQRLVPQQEVHTISTSTLNEGVYMIRIVLEDEAVEGQRLIIVN